MRIKSLSIDSRSEEIIFSVLLALASAVFLLNVLSLYTSPIPDSYLWWGDESWLMLEFRNQIAHGMFSHPDALGSSLTQGNGMILGNMWIPAIVYGLPAVLIGPNAMDIVLLGRTITLILSISLLIALFEIIRSLTSERLLAMLGVMLLLTSRSFLFTSHSARYDILTSLAILIGIFLLIRNQQYSIKGSAITGFLVASTLLITVHVTLALGAAAMICVVIRSKSSKFHSAIAFLSGFISFVFLLLIVSFFRGQMSFPVSSGSRGFALNLHDIPVFRFYSRSVLEANVLQRCAMFEQYALGYIVLLVGIFLAVLVQWYRTKKICIGLRIILLAIVCISWFECESAAPSSYLIYILPILSVGIVMGMRAVLSERLQYWIVALLSVTLAIVAFRDIPARHGKGYQLSLANSLAISSALGEIEQPEDRPQIDSNHHPLVLAFTPAIHEAMRDTDIRLMTTQFVEYPATNASVDSVIRQQGVEYVLCYASAIKPDFMREVGPIRAALDRIATPIWERPGYFTDIGRSYFDTILGEPDTLRVYRINPR